MVVSPPELPACITELYDRQQPKVRPGQPLWLWRGLAEWI